MLVLLFVVVQLLQQQPLFIEASDEEVAQSISVIFLFNMIAALLFPTLGTLLGFSTKSGEAFGIFAGTAINDTSSVTAAASTWDSMYTYKVLL